MNNLKCFFNERVFLSILFCVLTVNFCYCDDFQTHFNQANLYYEKGDYDKAIEEYNLILKNGFESGNLYYNLGNCYFKKGKLGLAILNYERAKRLLSFDKDLSANYKYAVSLIDGPKITYKRAIFLKFLDNLFDNFSLDGLTIFVSLMYILLLSTFMMALFLRRIQKNILFFCFLFILFFIASFLVLCERISNLGKEAIVIKKDCSAKFEPILNSTDYFNLYEGIKVKIIFQKDDWYKIKRQDNKIGWVKKEILEII